ncbi:Bacitracin export permease protein BceB [Paenibacillus auburnensis]|uniref:Bacitracin export permease protein BceB n=1 Tax=Paenibacillus auburnensis TaxID=2905649 RepID=A0ABN8GHD4_9BACL|nr:FtsX-like permease family protein [Paenibacillus auburnensis]CAH1204593.1 Bacitracin export permease protein BceB [Paenibacillus auburnensis]
MLTVFELVFRSMRQNVKHYYLYFFALIFSLSLFFVFASLQHDQQVQSMMEASVNFSAAFQSAAALLILIIGIFTVSSNRIFLRRRSREIGVFQLIGLSKSWVARYLVIENVLLGISALVAGIACGAMVSRLFVLILMKLLNLEGVPAISFSVSAALETAMVFILILVITSVQMIFMIYRSTLLHLFQADMQPDLSSPPHSLFTAIYAMLGVVLIGYGYKLSAHMVDDQLLLNALLVLLSTISGTYLLYRVTLRWCFTWLRKRKNGHLGLYNSLSLAPLIHRMKANANSLTLITVLSALTITLVTMAYSVYYSAEHDTRKAMPFDFAFENRALDEQSFMSELEREGINFRHKTIEAIRTNGVILNPLDESSHIDSALLWLPAEQLQRSGVRLSVPSYGEAVAYNAWASSTFDDSDFSKRYPTTVELAAKGQTGSYLLKELIAENLVNSDLSGNQLLVSEATLKDIENSMSSTAGFEKTLIGTYRISDKGELALASSLYQKYNPDGHSSPDFYSQYKEALQISGLLIFIAAFLGLAFLASTGSILYFKQMTEAEQEKQSFKTLRQLGFDTHMIMRGVIQKQMVVFLIPLFIGVLHSIFAVKAASVIIISDITIPTVISIGAYAAIYFLFALFTLGYYRKVVKNAML